MAIVWGSWVYSNSNGMRVGLDISWSAVDYTSTSTTATVGVYTQNQYNYSDAQTISYTNLGSNTNYTNNGSSGSTSLRATKTYTHTYGANPATINFRATLSGLYNGGSPTVSINSTTPTVPAPPVPPPPPIYVPTMGTTTATANIGSIDVAWSVSNNGGAGIDYYHVYKNGSYMGQYYTTSLNDPVGNGVTASYKVYAHNSAGWSAESNTASATTPSLPSTPGSFSANTSTFGTIGLSWTDSAGSGYGVTYTIARNGTTLDTTSSTSYSDTTVAPYTNYSYTVTPSTAVGSGTPASLSATSLGGIVKVWNGTSYSTALPKVWNGTTWVSAQARVWNGTEWKYGI